MKRRSQWQQHYVGNLARNGAERVEAAALAIDVRAMPKPLPQPTEWNDPLKAPFFAVGPELVRR